MQLVSLSISLLIFVFILYMCLEVSSGEFVNTLQTLLSKGNGFHFPPCYILELCGFNVLLECPVDLSALKIFSPIPSHSYQCTDVEDSVSLASNNPSSDEREHKRRKVEKKSLEAKDLICAEPWFKMVTNLHLWDLSFIDMVIISSPMGMLGLPFLTRNKNFSAKIYATEVTTRLGQLMMEDLVSMNMEFKQFYGPEESELPEWLKWNELELLPIELKNILMGEDGATLGAWQSLYSTADVKDCINKCQTLKYAEEACYNDTLSIKAFSSGLEIGASNWIINAPRKNITYLSSSIFESAHAMSFDYNSLHGNDLILFSDFSTLSSIIGASNDANVSGSSQDSQSTATGALRNDLENKDSLISSDDSSEEMDKIAFIGSCAIDSVRQGGSVVIPFGRIGIVLLLLEQISMFLESSNIEVPIFMISTVAEEILAYTNIVPEWLCKQRQENLYSGDALFGHVELLKRKCLHLFPAIHSIEFLKTWQEPCIVFAPHWCLRLGPVVHLLRRWCGDPNSLLVLEQEVDAVLALLPFKPVVLKVLQCSFLSGIKIQKIQSVLDMLRPKLVLFPQDLRVNLPTPSPSSYTVRHYSENETLHITSLKKDFEVNLATDLAFQLRPTMLKQENLAIARVKGNLILHHGKFMLDPVRELVESSTNQRSMKWGPLDPNLLLQALQEKGLNGSFHQEASKVSMILIDDPNKASIEIHAMRTVIRADDESLASLLFEAVKSVLNGI
ncbi:hypothetical protein AQUCO_03400191v1 [Aquilegia coerulea]|uniref:Beta-Casp domain-containing protein n=1 Tax=Aquilegia coerulea TaxID=218851 RepID=A0A2G5CXV3_AQUCA|nr:hypothetical protein AQUCO_03400191v1 [Aquilegia coerulea]